MLSKQNEQYSMEDLVGVIVVTSGGQRFGFITWGRIIDAVDEQWIVDMVALKAPSCAGIDEIKEIRVCESLQEVSSGKYFYEALFELSNEGIPFGKGAHARWLKERRKELAKGTLDPYFLGKLNGE